MADLSLGDLMEDGGVNKRAKMMRSIQSQAMQLRKVGFEPAEIDLLMRGRYGGLKPEEEQAFMEAMRKLSMIQRVGAVPGMNKSLRGYPGAGAGPADTGGMDALRGLGFGASGMQSLQDLMSQ